MVKLPAGVTEAMVECVAVALFQRDIEEDICEGSWQENRALHGKFRDDALAALNAVSNFYRTMLAAANNDREA